MPLQLEMPPTVTPSTSQPLVIRGDLQLYVNPGRSSLTTVMAQALRVAGQGTRVLVVQFLKGGIHQGPEHRVKLGAHLEWVRCGLQRCVDSPHLEPEEYQALAELWQFTRTAINSGVYGLVVLDELSLALRLGLIQELDVLDLLDHRPTALDVIVTGPEMPASLMERADSVTQLRQR